jgi:hypothetical protein
MITKDFSLAVSEPYVNGLSNFDLTATQYHADKIHVVLCIRGSFFTVTYFIA